MPAKKVWSKTSLENVMRHRSGTLYLNAKVAGVKVRQVLKAGTEPITDIKVARVARDALLEELRDVAKRGAGAVRKIGDALAVVEKRVCAGVGLKESTREFYAYLFVGLRRSLPVQQPGGVWTKEIAEEWWGKFAGDFSTNHANTGLRFVKLMAEELHQAGLCKGDTVKGLKRKRKGDPAVRGMPALERLEAVIASIRAQGKDSSEEAADLVEFLAWSGLRIGEAVEVLWEDVGAEFLTVTGGPLLTKNKEVRQVPINGRLRAVLERRRHEGAAGKIFSLNTPREALTAACARVKLKHLRVHDLRHWFATRAIEKGVDIPTVAKWLGHKDGGVLAMRTYGHLRDEHSLAAAAKMG